MRAEEVRANTFMIGIITYNHVSIQQEKIKEPGSNTSIMLQPKTT